MQTQDKNAVLLDLMAKTFITKKSKFFQEYASNPQEIQAIIAHLQQKTHTYQQWVKECEYYQNKGIYPRSSPNKGSA
ncbi:hypothetical protein [Helicobacter sp. 11S02596-1]|uniref:hypothetical protein n=1 Tax=Helicobacter sp. 11S02596-1 TaxID=1476194 RepID=UPI000BA6168D|nr:hypothetical protein [Helicobacter sp. 11S02596-1]PAF41380.1 hypothetical protein BJI48_08800 [Helicobacter sp. 11S02596-1]